MDQMNPSKKSTCVNGCSPISPLHCTIHTRCLRSRGIASASRQYFHVCKCFALSPPHPRVNGLPLHRS